MAKIIDVANRAGVSAATVSRALNNVGTVDPALAERVRAAAAELGYRPNGVARNLRRQRTDVWALIISDIENPFFTAVARGVEDIARERGFSVLLCNADEDKHKEDRYLQVAEQEQVAGVIISPNMRGSDISRMVQASIPVVTIDRTVRTPVDSVMVHSRAGAREATEHLFASGWRRPACITGPEYADTAEQRLQGYLDAVKDARRRPATSLIRHTNFQVEAAHAATLSLLGERRPPDAFFVANATMALGALQALTDRGLKPGRDVGLVAFDDAPWARLVDPPLTVVAQPAYDIGATAARLLTERIQRSAPQRPRHVTLSTELIVRQSSLRPG
ncbi:MAG TPA: LacI family DNA-binding transcriptional regulator [Segeticoccus sp.]|uniref:LacI family DNA-binding transcriptional regulator n=1 Tax=Segeticoccus sp. TaxID=2706531 RepID=UPI002D807D2D|nr:LacI family DNA-binding transcriptional regulator [Segeticoccus sp.]HET8599934.1 LacI family DNA-binding transcriptional regulator [Segeticoccus sp.]